MNLTPQIKIYGVPSGIAVQSPYHPGNNQAFRNLHGHFVPGSRRWILPPNALTQAKLNELFGVESPDVVAQVTPNDLAVVANHLVLGGYAVAHYDDRSKNVRLSEGVAITTGEWDVAASVEKKYPVISDDSMTLHIVVRKDYAESHDLKIEEELGYQKYDNPLKPYSDTDLHPRLGKPKRPC